MTYRSALAMEPPPPLPVPAGRCRFGELAVLTVPRRLRQHRAVPLCTEPAERRVQVGLSVSADVCLWHSLVACERLGAHLVRTP